MLFLLTSTGLGVWGWAYLESHRLTTKSGIWFNSVKKNINDIEFDFEEMTVILDGTHNAMSRMLSGYTTMSAVHKDYDIDTNIMNPLQFCQK